MLRRERQEPMEGGNREGGGLKSVPRLEGGGQGFNLAYWVTRKLNDEWGDRKEERGNRVRGPRRDIGSTTINYGRRQHCFCREPRKPKFSKQKKSEGRSVRLRRKRGIFWMSRGVCIWGGPKYGCGRKALMEGETLTLDLGPVEKPHRGKVAERLT